MSQPDMDTGQAKRLKPCGAEIQQPMCQGMRAFLKTGLMACGLIMQVLNPGYAQPSGTSMLEQVPGNWEVMQLARSYSFDMDSRHTGQGYRIVIGLPHKGAPPGGYPVLWALDGLASFPLMDFVRPRPATAGQSEAWCKKIGGAPAGLIVAVGYASGESIDVNARTLDYTPVTTGPTGDSFSPRHGGAEKLQERTMVDSAASFAHMLQTSGEKALQVSYQSLPARDHGDMLMHGVRHVIEFAFAP